MPTYLTVLLLTLFTIHFAIFLMLYYKRRHKPYILLCLTFLFMVVSTTLRHWAFEIKLGALPLYWIPRVSAWGSSGLFLYSKFKRK